MIFSYAQYRALHSYYFYCFCLNLSYLSTIPENNLILRQFTTYLFPNTVCLFHADKQHVIQIDTQMSPNYFISIIFVLFYSCTYTFRGNILNIFFIPS